MTTAVHALVPLPRRHLLFGAGAAALLSACGAKEPGPAVVDVSVTAQPGMNPAPDGADRPVTLLVLRLRDTGAFNAADYLAPQYPEAALGASLVGLNQLAVGPDSAATLSVTMEPDATALGFMAMLRDPSGKVWRAAIPVSPGSRISASVTLGPGGLAVQTG